MSVGYSVENSKQPFVSVIVPCFNEKKFISMCLDSITANDYPKEQLEMLVVDGMSWDGTRTIVEKYTQRHPFIRLVDNPKRIIPSAMNIGIRKAKGDIIMKMDAHSTYPKDYISRCVQLLKEYQADNVGGVLKIIPVGDTPVAEAIALTLAHPFGSGDAYIKIGLKEPRWADSAAYGCYRKEVFEKIGLYNEDVGSEDMDLNHRLRKAGGRILLMPDIVINYYADGDLNAFWRHNFADGVWITYPLKFGRKIFSWRHLAPLAFVLSLIGSAVLSSLLPFFKWLFLGIIGMYAVANSGASMHIALRERHIGYLAMAPIVFAVRHIAQGLGALLGLILVLIPGKHWKGRRGRKV